MKKIRLFKLVSLTLFVFKIFLTPSFANYDLEVESKLWEAFDKNLKEQEEQRLKQEEERQRLKQEEEKQRQKEKREAKALLNKLFSKNKTYINSFYNHCINPRN